ncbi:MAG: ABC transporter ATP-binding protein [Xanthobacteraceae bacterium]|nr:ABC transporter ATP-binding protein [Xanthobacteraceae bacterium]
MTPAQAPRATRSHADELRVEKVTKRFGGLKVFEDLSFTLAPGDVMGVIGPNGAGKTTLINVICGRLPPTSGKISLGGRDVTAKPVHTLSRMGLVRSFQQTNTFRPASVSENISRAIRFSGGSDEVRERIEDLLGRFDLSTRLDDQSDKLPYGLQKMLGLLLAYATSPKVLLLDEPAAGLEGRERTRVDDFVAHARATLGCSVLIVEHDMDLIRRLCPRIMVLDAGRVIAEGAPAEVLARKDVIDAYVGATDDEVPA